MSSRATKTDHVGMGMYATTVVRTRQLTPHLRRVTLGCPQLRGFRDDGPDQRVKLLLPRDGQDAPTMPTAEDWYGSWQRMPADVRPHLRTYTVRTARPQDGEVDVDMVVHGDEGPGTRFAGRARPGDRVGLHAAYGEYEADAGSTQLLAGDLSALPAVAAIVERLDPGTRADVVLEVDPADRVDLAAGPLVRVTWVAARDRPGAALVEAVRAACGQARPDYAWACADQATAAALRRHLVRGCGLPAERVMFMGYWRPGGPVDPD